MISEMMAWQQVIGGWLFQKFISSMDKEHQEVKRKLISITIMSLIFMSVQLVGGWLANSIAIFADAFHLLSDVLAYLISLWAVLLSTSANPPKYLTFGWQKAQPLGALVNVAIIYVVTAELFIQATKRMLNQTVVDEPFYMLITSFFGLGCNLIIMRILHSDPHGGHHGCSHGHSHGEDHSHEHSHKHAVGHNHQINTHPQALHQQISPNHIHSDTCGHTAKGGSIEEEEKNSGDEISDKNKPHKVHVHKHATHEQILANSMGSDEEIRNSSERRKKIKNINLEAAYIHVLTDIILSIGVIISALTIYFMSNQPEWTPWQLADPFCTYLFSFLAIYSTWPILKEAILLLLDSSHNKDQVEQIQRQLVLMQQVKQFSDLRIWSTNRDKHYAAVKVRMNKGFGGWRVSRIFALHDIVSYVQVLNEEAELIEE